MLEGKTIVKVLNRDNGNVGYVIPDLNITRSYTSGEVKEVTMEELRKLSYTPGGLELLESVLLIQNDDAVNELLNNVEQEYFYTEEDVKRVLIEGSIDELTDCLNFAPEGVLSLIKKLAVDLEINDIAKRNLIASKLGFNVTSAININHESKTGDEDTEKVERRVSTTPKETSKIPTRIIVK